MKLFRSAVTWLAFGAGAATAAALVAGNRRLEQWENMTLDDCDEGDFCRLSNGWRIHFVEKGSGDPVVLLHGFMDSLDTWRRNMDALAVKHHVIAVDRLGYGFSERVTERVYSLKQQARLLKEFLDLRGIERATLVGHSMGGAIAVQFTYDFPERVNKLVLLAPAVYFDLPQGHKLLGMIPPYIARGVLGLYSTRPEAVKVGLLNAYGDRARLSDEAVQVRARVLRVRGSANAFWSRLASPSRSDLPEAVTHIEHPTLIIWGDRDRVVPLRHARRLRRELPHAQLAIVETAGHIPHEECAVEVNALINDFLEMQGQPTWLPSA